MARTVIGPRCVRSPEQKLNSEKYGQWFDRLVLRIGSAVDLRRVLQAVNTPPHGFGLAGVMEFLDLAVNAAVGTDEKWKPHVALIQKIRQATQEISGEFTALGSVTTREHNIKAYGAFCVLASSTPRSIPEQVYGSAGWLVLDAIRDQTTISAKAAAQILTLERSRARKNPDPGWTQILGLKKIDAQSLSSLNLAGKGNPESTAFLRKLLVASSPNKGVPQIRQESTLQNAPQTSNAAASNGNFTEDIRKDRSNRALRRNTQVPSVAPLKARAAYVPALDTFGLENSWNYLSPHHLQATTKRMFADLTVMGNAQLPVFAEISILSLLISHDHRPTLKLSLIPNNDLWLSIEEKSICFNRRRLLGLKGEMRENDLVRIPLPPLLLQKLASRLISAPDAEELRQLYEIEDLEDFLRKLESYSLARGDSAHKSHSARHAHSMGVTLIHCGTMPEVAAFLGFALHLAGDSAPNYLKLSNEFIFKTFAKAYEFLGFGEIEATGVGGWVGNPKCPTDDEVRKDWEHLSATFSQALAGVKCAQDVSSIVKSFNAGSAANAIAYRWTTAGRMQRVEQPSRQDVLVHAEFAFSFDKVTKPSSERLTPRTLQLNTVITAQQLLVTETTKWLRKIGVAEQEIPQLLINPNPHSSFFTVLEEITRKQGDGKRLIARPLSILDLESEFKCRKGIAHNAARYFWASKVAISGGALWLERTILGHGRKLAVPGSYCTGVSPNELLNDARHFMAKTLEELALVPYGGINCPSVKFIQVQENLQKFDSQKTIEKSHKLNSSTQCYCSSSTLSALRISDEIRVWIGSADNEDASRYVLMSLIFNEGLTDARDIESLWPTLKADADIHDAHVHSWARQSGQEIEMPIQPSTKVHLQRIKELASLELAIESVRPLLKQHFPCVNWPKTARGLLGALCMLMHKWTRVHISPVLIHCYHASTVASTFSRESRLRIQYGVSELHVNAESTSRIAHTRLSRFQRVPELQRLRKIVGHFANGDKRKGEDLARGKKLCRMLNRLLDKSSCRPLTVLLWDWIEAEVEFWEKRCPDLLSIASLYEYLTRFLHRLTNLHPDQSPVDWSEDDWKQFMTLVLDVEGVDEDRKNDVRNLRRIAVSRMLGTLTFSGKYIAARDVIEPSHHRPGKIWCESYARVFVPAQAIEIATRQVDALYADWEIERLQCQSILELAIWSGSRSDEISALRLADIGHAVATLTSSGFSHLKTERSRRVVDLPEDLEVLLTSLGEKLRGLSVPPSYLFSQDVFKINLSVGRAYQAVIVDLLRNIVGDERFCFHSLRGTSMAMHLAPGCDKHLQRILAGDFPVKSAIAVWKALSSDDPRHVARCFSRTGHISHQTPAAAYMAPWPLWYAAEMRATQANARLDSSLCEKIPEHDHQLLRQERVRFKDSGVDEWQWAILPPRSKRSSVVPGNVEQAASKVVPPVPKSASELEKVSYGVLRILGEGQAQAEHDAKVGRAQSNAIERLLLNAPEFDDLHHRTPNRVAKEARPLRSVHRKYLTKDFDAIIYSIVSADAKHRGTLLQLLTGSCDGITSNDLSNALAALPADFKIELCWPKGCLEPAVVESLRGDKRVVGLCPRRHVSNGIRARVFRDDPKVTQPHITFTTTLVRAALVVKSLIN